MGGKQPTPEQLRKARDRVAGFDYAPGAVEEVTLPEGDEWGRSDETGQDGRTPQVAPEVLRDGGPTGGRGMVTTTGGDPEPAQVTRRPRTPEAHRGKVAPTTTGDATTGGFVVPPGGPTSDQYTEPEQVTDLADARDLSDPGDLSER